MSEATLSEFLLARVTEDEADAMSGWRWKSLPAGEYERLQARVLSECEAKRRIVEAATWEMKDGSRVAYELDEDTLRLLALPYADHPDYRDEWRP